MKRYYYVAPPDTSKTAKERVRDHLLFFASEFRRIDFQFSERILRETLRRLEEEL